MYKAKISSKQTLSNWGKKTQWNYARPKAIENNKSGLTTGKMENRRKRVKYNIRQNSNRQNEAQGGELNRTLTWAPRDTPTKPVLAML